MFKSEYLLEYLEICTLATIIHLCVILSLF